LIYAITDGDLSKYNQIYNMSYEVVLKFYYFKLINKLNEMLYTIAILEKNKREVYNATH